MHCRALTSLSPTPRQALKALREAAEKVRKHTQDAPTAEIQAPAGKDAVAGKEQRVEAAASFSEEDMAQSKVMLALGALVSSEQAAGMQVGAASVIKNVSDTARNSHLSFLLPPLPQGKTPTRSLM